MMAFRYLPIFLALSEWTIRVSASAPIMPNVTLPWGTWVANSVDENQVITFDNIRFGKAPTGSLRFQRPQFPDSIANPNTTIMNNTYGPTCNQVKSTPTTCNKTICVNLTPQLPQSEDCLFLDVYVPKSVWAKGQQNIADTPVVVWIYGGAYEFGAKNALPLNMPLYRGNGLVEAVQEIGEDVIFVAGNYRLGAFGWLAGPTMEANNATNLGLYDQRLVLEWVQSYIHLFGGDKDNVAAWGESAGAGSIMHHLMAVNPDGSQQDPLFHKAFLQSAAFEWQWDRTANGTLEKYFQNFTQLANCTSGGFQCLVNQDETVLVSANQQLWANARLAGVFPVGPAVDGYLIDELPAVAYQKGNVWKGLTSLGISHVSHESHTFVPCWVTTDSNFTQIVEIFFSGECLTTVRQNISDQYPPHWYESTQHRLQRLIGDSTFVCNSRQIFDAYSPSIDVYMMEYNFLEWAAQHATDLIPSFWNSAVNVTNMLESQFCLKPIDAIPYADLVKNLAPRYQNYLANLAVFGNPSTKPGSSGNPTWQGAVVDDEGRLTSVLEVGATGKFDPDITDIQNTAAICGFWNKIALEITAAMATENCTAPPVDSEYSGGSGGGHAQQVFNDEL